MKCRCPVCHKIINAAAQRRGRQAKCFPFCCQRCKLIDLGRWLDADYRIAATITTDDSEQAGDKNANVGGVGSREGTGGNTGQSGG